MHLRIIDLDGSLPAQSAIGRRLSDATTTRLDLRSIGPGLRVIASRRAIADFSDRVNAAFGPPTGRNEVYFYGSGDFHHLTSALVGRVREPLTIIHFDNHPDWCRLPATCNCGGWVNRALEMPHVAGVVTLGPCSADFVKPEWQTANLPAIVAGRLKVYPWRVAPSTVWWHYPDTACFSTIDGALHWRNLADEPWQAFVAELIEDLPTTALWITIDKDVLSPAEATTNWDQGQMPIDHVLSAVTRLAEHRPIMGIDVCGDYSPPVYAGLLRSAIANFDNPPRSPPSADALAINAATNERLLATFDRILP